MLRIRRIAAAHFALLSALAGCTTLRPVNSENSGREPASTDSCENLISRLLVLPLSKVPERVTRRWDFGPEFDAQVRALFDKPAEELSSSAKYQKLYELLWEERIKRANPATRLLMRAAYRSALDRKSVYGMTLGRVLGDWMGPHFNPIFNRVVLPADSLSAEWRARDLLIASHELGHAFHRNTRPQEMLAMMWAMTKELYLLFLPRVMTPALMYHAESNAIAAQYEFVRAIPRAARQALLQEMRKSAARRSLKVDEKITLAWWTHAGVFDKILQAYKTVQGVKVIRPDEIHPLARTVVHFGPGGKARVALRKKIRSELLRMRAESKTVADQLALDSALGILKKGNDVSTLFKAAPTQKELEAVIRPYAPDDLALQASDDTLRLLDKIQDVLLEERHGFNSGKEGAFQQIFVRSLEAADLPKEEFIRTVREFHNYGMNDLYLRFNGPRGFFRATLRWQALVYALIYWNAKFSTFTDENIDQALEKKEISQATADNLRLFRPKSNVFWAAEIQWLCRYFDFLIEEELEDANNSAASQVAQ